MTLLKEMNNKIQFRQFDVFIIQLDPTVGSEQKGTRPCLLIESNSSINSGNTALVIPFTSKNLNHIHPFEVFISIDKRNGLFKSSKLKVNQIRTIDKSRISQKLGTLEPKYHEQVFTALDNIIDRWGDFRSKKS